MIEVTYEETLYDEHDAILNEEFEGFKEDYLCLHSLIRRYQPKSFFEIGTNMGVGTNIIANAMETQFPQSDGKEAWPFVYTLDLPTELAHISLQHPISEGKGDRVGERCTFPFTQLRGDSMKFDFSKYPCEGYFIDGEHDFKHARRETLSVMALFPKIVIYHDADILDVYEGIVSGSKSHVERWKTYDLFRVVDTRIAYALKK